jgi:hypothetical protein
MTKKVQSKGEDHQTNLFYHGLVKVMVLQRLSKINMPWEVFIQSTSLLLATSQPSSQSTPSAPPRPHEVGSSSRLSIRNTPMAEIIQTYKKGKILVFSPESTKKMSTSRILTRAQTRPLPKDTIVEQVQGELEQSPRHATDSPLQQFEEEMPHEKEMFDHRDKSNA